jgi:hypothetical protein
VRLSKEWKRILDKEGLEDFHMSDCVMGRAGTPYENWTEDRRDGLVFRLVNIIRRHVMARTWTAVLMADYRKVFKTDDLPYSICAIGCASRLRQYSLTIPSKPLIPYAFDHGGRGSDLIFAEFRALLDSGENERHYRMGMVSQGVRRLCLPLQAADLHVYEVYRYFSNQLMRSDLPLRQPFDSLLSIAEAGGGGHLFNSDRLQLLVDGDADEVTTNMPVDNLNRQRRVRIITP